MEIMARCDRGRRTGLTPRADARTTYGHHAVLEAVVDALATYRLTVLVKDDKITEGLRAAVFRRFGPVDGDHPRKPSYLMGCPWCLSVYFGAMAVAGHRFAPRAWRPLSRVLALSAATGLLTEVRSPVRAMTRQRALQGGREQGREGNDVDRAAQP